MPALSADYRLEYDPIISTLSLANPRSLSWAIEMRGYALFGAATWFASSLFRLNKIEHAARRLMIANGIISLSGAVVTSISLGWVLTIPGIISFATWNALMLALSICALIALVKRKARAET